MKKLAYSLFALSLMFCFTSCEQEEIAPFEQNLEQVTDPADPLEEDGGVKGN